MTSTSSVSWNAFQDAFQIGDSFIIEMLYTRSARVQGELTLCCSYRYNPYLTSLFKYIPYCRAHSNFEHFFQTETTL